MASSHAAPAGEAADGGGATAARTSRGRRPTMPGPAASSTRGVRARPRRPAARCRTAASRATAGPTGWGCRRRRCRRPTASATAVPFGPVSADQERDVERAGRRRTRRGWSMRIGRPSHSAVSPRRRPCTARTYVSTSAHRSGALPEGVAAGEARPDGDGHSAWAPRSHDGGDGGGVGHRVAQRRHQHGRSEPDRPWCGSAAERERTHTSGADGRRCRTPTHVTVPERLGDADVLRGVGAGGEGTGDVHGGEP